MKFYYFLLLTVVLVFSPPVSSHFFLNDSSAPPQWTSNATKNAWDMFRNLTGCGYGETKDGLSKLKRYFHQFGYIHDLPSNCTNEFDQALESAIRTYQRNFNLEPTGQLDEKTLLQITRPRCGNADIVNGTTTMNSGRPTASNSSRLHTVGHYSLFPGMPRWPENRRDLKYAFWPGNQLTDEVKKVFATAFARWSEVIPMTFTQTDSFATADIKIGFFSRDHGDGVPFDGPFGTLAHAFSPPSGHFHLDNDEEWVVSGNVVSSLIKQAVDLESVVVHEIGHLLGLGHSSVENSIMYPAITSGTRKVELESDDIQGVQFLYGRNPNFSGSSRPSSQQPETRDRDDDSGAAAPGLWRWWSLMCVFLTVGFIDVNFFM